MDTGVSGGLVSAAKHVTSQIGREQKKSLANFKNIANQANQQNHQSFSLQKQLLQVS